MIFKQWVNKFRAYFGLDLPERTLEFNFQLQATAKRRKRPQLNIAKLSRHLGAPDSDTQDLLEKLRAYLKILNRYRISPARRKQLIDRCLVFYCPAAEEMIQRFRKNGGIPDALDRQQLLDLGVEVATLLTVALKQIFQHYYNLANWRYVRVREDFCLTAFRIMELTRLEQEMRALRYQQLESQAWSDIHTIYAIIWSYEKTNQEEIILASMVKKYKPDSVPATMRRSNIHAVYISIQAMAILDNLAWPTQQMSLIESYVKALISPLTIAIDAGGVLHNDAVIIYYGQSRPPYLERQQRPSTGPVLVLQLSPLKKQIQNDYPAVLQAQEENNQFLVPRIMKQVPNAYQLPLLDLMNKKCIEDNWIIAGENHKDEMPDLRIYSSMEECYSLLNDIYYPSIITEGGRNFKDTLAQRSAVIGEDSTATKESQWFLLKDDGEEIDLLTQETRFTTHMHVGRLVAFGFSKEGIHAPDIGYVTRLYRPSPRQVQVTIQRLAVYGEPIRIMRFHCGSVKKNFGESPLGALLVKSTAGEWCIQTPGAMFWKGYTLEVKRDREDLTLVLGELMSVSNEFRMFTLEGEGLENLQPKAAP